MPKRKGFPSPQDRFRFPSLGKRTGGFGLRIPLNEDVSQCKNGGSSHGWLHTGVKGGELKVGVGSRVERAEAPVSPRGSAPRPLDFRRGRGILL